CKPDRAKLGTVRLNSLLRVKLDDELLLQRHVDLSALGQLVHEDAQGFRNNLQPSWYNSFAETILSLFEPFHLLGTLADIDDVVLRYAVRRNIGLLAVHGEVTVGDKLTCLTTGTCQTCAVDDVVKTAFQQDNQVVAGLTWLTVCVYVVATELTLKHTVGVLCLLLLLKLQHVLSFLDARSASLSRSIWAAFESHVAADQVDAKTAGYTSSGAGITSHSLVSLPSLKRGDASVVGSHCVAEELRQRWTKLPSRRPVVSGLRFRGPNLGP